MFTYLHIKSMEKVHWKVHSVLEQWLIFFFGALVNLFFYHGLRRRPRGEKKSTWIQNFTTVQPAAVTNQLWYHHFSYSCCVVVLFSLSVHLFWIGSPLHLSSFFSSMRWINVYERMKHWTTFSHCLFLYSRFKSLEWVLRMVKPTPKWSWKKNMGKEKRVSERKSTSNGNVKMESVRWLNG